MLSEHDSALYSLMCELARYDAGARRIRSPCCCEAGRLAYAAFFIFLFYFIFLFAICWGGVRAPTMARTVLQFQTEGMRLRS